MESKVREAHEQIAQQKIEISTHRQDHKMLQSKLMALENVALEASTVKTELAQARDKIQQMSGLLSQADDQKRLQDSLRVAQATIEAQKV